MSFHNVFMEKKIHINYKKKKKNPQKLSSYFYLYTLDMPCQGTSESHIICFCAEIRKMTVFFC